MRLFPFSRHKANLADATGVSLSAICVLHCVAFPTAAAAAPILAPGLSESLGVSHEWHHILLAIAVPVSLVALLWGMRSVRESWPIIAAGAAGLGLMALGAMHLFTPGIETAITLAGVTVLASAHIANWRVRTRNGHDHARDCAVCVDTAPKG